jgi:hypothetical protein
MTENIMQKFRTGDYWPQPDDRVLKTAFRKFITPYRRLANLPWTA